MSSRDRIYPDSHAITTRMDRLRRFPRERRALGIMSAFSCALLLTYLVGVTLE